MPAQVYVVDKLKLNVIVEGSGSPVVLLHGFPDSSKLWQPQVLHTKQHARIPVMHKQRVMRSPSFADHIPSETRLQSRRA
jgi:pimeloyl-ACP methyl ester carboxylesterase